VVTFIRPNDIVRVGRTGYFLDGEIFIVQDVHLASCSSDSTLDLLLLGGGHRAEGVPVRDISGVVATANWLEAFMIECTCAGVDDQMRRKCRRHGFPSVDEQRAGITEYPR
jgi:hypothetical protein